MPREISSEKANLHGRATPKHVVCDAETSRGMRAPRSRRLIQTDTMSNNAPNQGLLLCWGGWSAVTHMFTRRPNEQTINHCRQAACSSSCRGWTLEFQTCEKRVDFKPLTLDPARLPMGRGNSMERLLWNVPVISGSREGGPRAAPQQAWREEERELPLSA